MSPTSVVRFLVFLPLCFASCRSPAVITPRTASAVAPAFRLPPTVRPVRYKLELTVVPDAPAFSGVVDIDLLLAEPTRVIWLNADSLVMGSASLRLGSETLAAVPLPVAKDFVGFSLPRAVGPGPAHLRVAYHGRFDPREVSGLFSQKEGEAWYAFTQFESTDARRAFPCFDEPQFKVPWTIILHVRQEHVAVANTPVVAEAAEEKGMKRITFAQSKPMPSYLVAIGVGPFDIIDAGTTSQGAPIRIVSPRGHADKVGFAVATTRPILGLLEDYFGTPYPYEKLDLLVVPHYQPGAMENPGLITFRSDVLLVPPAELTRRTRRRFATVVAHELAHQWFGDYVTMAWWDDIWLNESFATWLERKIIQSWKPEWRHELDVVDGRGRAMRSDGLASARRVRQPVETPHDLANMFDGIIYNKGAAVLHMFEQFVGEDRFRAGVRAYLAKHAWGNATAEDFVAALSAAAGQDLAGPFASFLDQTGVPLVGIELRCDVGAKPRLVLEQSRYARLGSPKSDGGQAWQVPVCIKYGAGKASGRECALMSGTQAELALQAETCPDWVVPNENSAGYYRILPKSDLLKRQAPMLTVVERLGRIDDLVALDASGQLPAAETLALLDTGTQEHDVRLMSAQVDIALAQSELVPDALLGQYARFVRKVFGSRAFTLGFKSHPGEDDEAKDLRARLLNLVAVAGQEQVLAAEARSLAHRWLADPSVVEPEVIATVLAIAARTGDASLHDRIHRAAKATRDRRERSRLLEALGDFRDLALVRRNLEILLAGEFEPDEAIELLWGAFNDRSTRDTAYAWLKDHFEVVTAKLPRDDARYLAFGAAGFCDAEHRVDVERFFGQHLAGLAGGPRILSQVLERIDQCIAYRAAQAASLSAFLNQP